MDLSQELTGSFLFPNSYRKANDDIKSSLWVWFQQLCGFFSSVQDGPLPLNCGGFAPCKPHSLHVKKKKERTFQSRCVCTKDCFASHPSLACKGDHSFAIPKLCLLWYRFLGWLLRNKTLRKNLEPSRFPAQGIQMERPVPGRDS